MQTVHVAFAHRILMRQKNVYMQVPGTRNPSISLQFESGITRDLKLFYAIVLLVCGYLCLFSPSVPEHILTEAHDRQKRKSQVFSTGHS